MAKINCKQCGQPVTETMQRCGNCEAVVMPEAASISSGERYAVAWLAAILIGGAVSWYSLLGSDDTVRAATVDVPTGDIERGEEYFYCGYTNLDGSGQDYSKWGKGTDYTYNEGNSRWEWITEYTYQYIYLDGKYEQEARVAFFDDQKGICNLEMELIYTQRLSKILQGN